MIRHKALLFVAMAAALAAAQLVDGTAWAKKAPQNTAAAAPPAASTSGGNCPNGVSKGCSPGNCRCP